MNSAKDRRNKRRAEKALSLNTLKEMRRNIEIWAIETGMTLVEAHADLLEMNS